MRNGEEERTTDKEMATEKECVYMRERETEREGDIERECVFVYATISRLYSGLNAHQTKVHRPNFGFWTTVYVFVVNK